MQLDRTFQREILEQLRDAYPETVDFRPRDEFAEQGFQGNLFYLKEHGLINGAESRGRNSTQIVGASITAAGLDFLEDDGGLSAIFKTVTVRLDGESILPVLEKIIAASNQPPEQKKSMVQKLKGLSGKVLETLIIKSVEMGVEHPDKMADLISSVIS